MSAALISVGARADILEDGDALIGEATLGSSDVNADANIVESGDTVSADALLGDAPAVVVPSTIGGSAVWGGLGRPSKVQWIASPNSKKPTEPAAALVCNAVVFEGGDSCSATLAVVGRSRRQREEEWLLFKRAA